MRGEKAIDEKTRQIVAEENPSGYNPDAFVELERQKEEKKRTEPMVMFFDKEQAGLPTDMALEVSIFDTRTGEDREQERPTETFVIVGGAGEDIEVMQPLVDAIASQGKQVVAVAMPSYGASADASKAWRKDEHGKPKQDFTDYNNLLHALKAQLGEQVAEKLTLVGHSIGAVEMASYAAAHPGDVERVVLLNPAGVESSAVVADTIPLDLFTQFVKTHAKEVVREKWNAMRTKRSHELPPVVTHAWLRSIFGEKSVLPKRLMQHFWEASVAAQGKLTEMVEEITSHGTPVDVIAGTQDTLFPLDVVKRLQEHGARVHVGDWDHYGPIELDKASQVATIVTGNDKGDT